MKVALCFFLILLPALGSAQPGRRKVSEGNRAYAEKRFDAALDAYQDALIEDARAPVIHYNLGAALYQKKDYEKALESYDRVFETDDPLFQSRAHYNLGNTLYRAGRLQEAIQAYEEALKLNPEDEDARYNLEFVRNKLKQDAQPESGGPQDQKQDQESQSGEQESREDQEQQEQHEQQEQQEGSEQQKQQEARDSEDADEKEDHRQSRPDERRETTMTQEEAERLLNALSEDQDELQKQKARAAVGSGRADIDW